MIDKTNPLWYVLWAPLGFGVTTRIGEVEDICRQYDLEAKVWYPLYPVVVNGKTRMRPFYAGYMFVHCKWHNMIEKTLGDEFPVYSKFLKDIDTNEPVFIPEETMDEVNKAVAEMLKQPEFILNEYYEVGTLVRVLRKPFFGLIGKVENFQDINNVVVELDMFGRNVPVTVDVHDLERVG